jgi:hypothetical protein
MMMCASRAQVKESNVPHVVLEIDTPSSSEYAADPTAAMVLLKNTIALTQTERVNTNTMPCTWSLRTLSKEDQAAYSKITKVWTPKEASSAPIMIDLDKLAGEQLAAAKVRETAATVAEGETAGGPGASAAGGGGGGGGGGEGGGGDGEEDREVAELQRLLASGPPSKRFSPEKAPPVNVS